MAGDQGLCLHWDGALRPLPFGPGAHVVSSDHDLDDPALPEGRRFRELLAAHPGVPGYDALRGFLSSHEEPRPVCKHGPAFGTVSSTLLQRTDRGTSLAFATGNPCRNPFETVKLPGLLTAPG